MRGHTGLKGRDVAAASGMAILLAFPMLRAEEPGQAAATSTQAAGPIDSVEKLARLPSLNRMFWLQAPPARQAPTIDGTLSLDKGEWSDASCFYGFSVYRVGVQMPIPAWTYVTWDKTCLYLGIRTMVPEGARLRRKCRSQDDPTAYHDDALEIVFNPLGRGQAEPAMYRAAINGMGFCVDEKIFVGVFARNWNGQWNVKTDYRAGMDRWDVEIAIPVRPMGIQEENRPGQVWRFLVCRDWKKLVDAQTGAKHWNIYSSLGTSVGFAYVDAGGGLALHDKAPVVQLLDMKDLDSNRIGFTARIANTTAAPLPLRARAKVFSTQKGGVGKETDDWDTKRGEPIEVMSRDWALKPGEEALWKVPAGEVPALPELPQPHHYEMLFVVESADGQTAYYRLQRGFTAWALKADASPYALPLSVTYNPVRKNAKVLCDLIDDPNRDRARAVVAEVYDVGSTPVKDKPIAQAKVTGVKRDYIQGVFDLPALTKTGEYPVAAHLLGDDGGVLATVETKLEKLDEAKQFPWWNSKVGILDKPIPPHREMRYGEGKVTTTTGEYRFDGTALPTQITMTSEPLLASPIRLVCSIGGQPLHFQSPAAPTVMKQSNIETDLSGALISEPLRIQVSNHLEYDGCNRVVLDIEPKAGPVTVDYLRLEIPFLKERAQFLWSFAQDCRVGLLLVDLTRKDGQVWNSLDRTGFGQAVGTFWPQYVVHDSLRGLCWFADNDKGWVPVDNVPAAEVERGTPATVLRFHFIGQPFPLAAKRQIVFGLLGLPARPLPAGSRLYHRRAENFGNYVGDKVMNYSPPLPRDFRKAQAYIAEGTTYDKKTFEPAGKSGKWSPNFEFAPWHDSHNMFRMPDTDPRFFSYCSLETDGAFTQTAIDYKVWILSEYIRQTDIAGFYFDTPDSIGYSAEVSSGVAYVIPEGQPAAGDIQPGYTIFGWREYVKRVRGVFFAHGRDIPWMEMHATHGPIVPTTPFLEVRTEGEGYRLPASRNFMAAWSRLHLRGIDVPPLYGIVNRWLSGYPWDGKVPDVDPQRTKIGALLLHDIFTGWGEFNQGTSVYQNQAPSTRGPKFGYKHPNVSQKLIAHGMNRDEVAYLPYWQNQNRITLTGEKGGPASEVLASVWRIPSQNKALVVVANYNEQPVKGVRVALDAAKLGLQPGDGETLAAADFETGEPIETQPVLDFCPLDFALLVFARARAAAGSPVQQLPIKSPEGASAETAFSTAAVRQDLIIHGFCGPDVKAYAGKEAAECLTLDGSGKENVVPTVYHLQAQDKALIALKGGDAAAQLQVRLNLEKLQLVPDQPGRNLLVMELRSGGVLQETTHRSRGRQFFRTGGANDKDLGVVQVAVPANDTVLLLFANQ